MCHLRRIVAPLLTISTAVPGAASTGCPHQPMLGLRNCPASAGSCLEGGGQTGAGTADDSRTESPNTTFSAPVAETTQLPPSVLFILADDLGWSDLSNEGSRYYESLHIDSIAADGMKFLRGYAASRVCSPSRASIMTGKYTPKHGITSWIGDPSGTDWRRNGRHDSHLPAEYEHGLRTEEVTLAEVLLSANYRTFYAGKYHLGPDAPRGFEINKGGHHVGSPPGGYFSPYANPALVDGPASESLPIRLGQETANFIDAHAEDAPFFAFLAFYSVHSPIQTTQVLWQKYRDKAVLSFANENITSARSRFRWDRRLPVRTVQDCPIYAGMIEAMDNGVGLALGALERAVSSHFAYWRVLPSSATLTAEAHCWRWKTGSFGQGDSDLHKR